MAFDLPSPAPTPTHSETRVPPRPALPPPGRRIPPRPLLLGGFVLVLGAACMVALRADGGDAPPTRSDPLVDAPATVSTNEAARARTGTTFDVAVGDTTGCQTLSGAEPQLLCPLPNGVVTFTQVANPMTSYRSVAGAEVVAARGDAACAAGHPEARTWARPHAPASAAGRYLCRIVGGRAELWWTVDDAGVLGHAYRRDDDLAALFSWWRSRTEDATDHP